MKKALSVFLLFLCACAAEEEVVKPRPQISAFAPPPLTGMTYAEFRRHEIWGQGDMLDVQKRFLMLDENNNGRLSAQELRPND